MPLYRGTNHVEFHRIADEDRQTLKSILERYKSRRLTPKPSDTLADFAREIALIERLLLMPGQQDDNAT